MPRRDKLSEGTVRFIRESGLSALELSKTLGVSPSAVSQARMGRTWAGVEAPTRGDSRAKLTREQVEAIRAGSESCRWWARKLGVSPSTIHSARVGTTWKA